MAPSNLSMVRQASSPKGPKEPTNSANPKNQVFNFNGSLSVTGTHLKEKITHNWNPPSSMPFANLSAHLVAHPVIQFRKQASMPSCKIVTKWQVAQLLKEGALQVLRTRPRPNTEDRERNVGISMPISPSNPPHPSVLPPTYPATPPASSHASNHTSSHSVRHPLHPDIYLPYRSIHPIPSDAIYTPPSPTHPSIHLTSPPSSTASLILTLIHAPIPPYIILPSIPPCHQPTLHSPHFFMLPSTIQPSTKPIHPFISALCSLIQSTHPPINPKP